MKQISEMSLDELVAKASAMANDSPPQIAFNSTTTTVASLAAIAVLAYLAYGAFKGFNLGGAASGAFGDIAGSITKSLEKSLASAGNFVIKLPSATFTYAQNQGQQDVANQAMQILNKQASAQDTIAAIPPGKPGYNAALYNYYKKNGWVTAPQYSITDPQAFANWQGAPSTNAFGASLGIGLGQALSVQMTRTPGFGTIFNPSGTLASIPAVAYNTAVLQKAGLQERTLNESVLTGPQIAQGWKTVPQYTITDPNAFLNWTSTSNPNAINQVLSPVESGLGGIAKFFGF